MALALEPGGTVAKKKTPGTRKAAKKTAKKAGRKPSAAFMKPVTPSATLAAVVGDKPIPRTEVTKLLWAYIKKNGLQDPKNKRMIKADESLKSAVRRQGDSEHVRDDETRRQAPEVGPLRCTEGAGSRSLRLTGRAMSREPGH